MKYLAAHVTLFLLLSAGLSVSASAQAPNVTSLSPSVGPVSPIGGSVTIKGINFGTTQGGSTVTFGGIVTTPTFWSSTKIVVPVPGNLAAGFVDVILTVNGVPSPAKSFLVIPVITRVSPASAPVGTPVTFTGSSFGDQQGASSITFNGIAGIPTAWTNTSITALVPVGAVTGGVVATVNGFATNAVSFPVLPHITGLGPIAAPGGASATITGTTFGSTQGFGAVAFNGVSATIQSWTDTSITALVPANATSGDVIVTTARLLTSNAFAYTVVQALTIVAVLSPLSNGAGWNNGPVTVSFQCSGGLPPIVCPLPQTVGSEGANQVVVGTVTDAAGNQAATSLAVNVDQTGPSVVIGLSINGTTATRPTLRLTGSFSDNLSGVASVNCNGSEAILAAASFTCYVSLVAGANLVQVHAIDNAGNAEVSAPASVTYSPVQPTAILITPTLSNLLAGQSRSVRLVGDLGQPVLGANWAISDPMVANVSADDPPQLTGVAPGTAILTATFGGLTATATVNVLAGTALPFGAPLWSADPSTGGVINDIIRANHVSPSDPDAYMIDGESTLRAFTADGQQLWAVQIASGPAPAGAAQIMVPAVQQSPMRNIRLPGVAAVIASLQAAPDPLQVRVLAQRQELRKRMDQNSRTAHSGTIAEKSLALAAAAGAGPDLLMRAVSDNDSGVINLVFSCGDTSCASFTPSFVRIDNISQDQVWAEAITDGPFIEMGTIAVAADNTVYAPGVFLSGPDTHIGQQTRSLLVALDGASGVRRFTVPLPIGHRFFTLLDADGTVRESDSQEVGADVGPISVMPDGSVQALLFSAEISDTETRTGPGSPCGSVVFGFSCTTAISHHKKLQLMIVQPDGSSALQPVEAYDFDASGCVHCSDPGNFNSYFPGDVIPDGSGGVLASWTRRIQLPNTATQFRETQMMRHISNSGAPLDIDMGAFLVPRLQIPFGGYLVLGENNRAFASGGHAISAVDFLSGTEPWTFQTNFGNGVSLLAATANGGLLAGHLASDVNGPTDASISFDASGVATLTAASATVTNVSYFDPNSLLAISSLGQGQLIADSASIVTPADPTWLLPRGNTFVQRSPQQILITKTLRNRAMVGGTTNIVVQGTGFGRSPQLIFRSVDNPNPDLTISNFHYDSSSGVITADIEVAADAVGGKVPILVKGGSRVSKANEKAFFFVQIPTGLQRFDLGAAAPGGVGPLAILTDGPVTELDGTVLAQHQCGVYRNYTLQLMDQDRPPHPIEQAYDITETLVFAPPCSQSSIAAGKCPNQLQTSANTQGVIADTQSITATVPDCLGPDEHQSVTQGFFVSVGNKKFFLTTAIQIQRGNFSGTPKVDSIFLRP